MSETTPAGPVTPSRLDAREQAYLLLALTSLLWAGNAVAARLAVGTISPMALTFGRWLAVSLLIGLFLGKAFREAWPTLKRHKLRILLMGALGFSAFNSLMYIAGHHTTALNITLMQGAIPVAVLLGSFAVHGTPVSALQMIGVGITLAGVAATASGGELARLLALSFNLGDIIMLAACVLYAGYTVFLKSRPATSALGFFSGVAAAAMLTSLPLAVGEALAGGLLVTPTGLIVLAYVALGPSFLAQLTFMRGVELIGPGRAGVFVNMTPVFGALLAVALLGEPFGWHHALAMALVLGGIAIAERGRT